MRGSGGTATIDKPPPSDTESSGEDEPSPIKATVKFAGKMQPEQLNELAQQIAESLRGGQEIETSNPYFTKVEFQVDYQTQTITYNLTPNPELAKLIWMQDEDEEEPLVGKAVNMQDKTQLAKYIGRYQREVSAIITGQLSESDPMPSIAYDPPPGLAPH